MADHFIFANFKSMLISWFDAKRDVERSMPFGDGWLHAIAGAVVFCAAAWLLRKPFSNLQPWLVVFVLASLNEVIDFAVAVWRSKVPNYSGSAGDILFTIAIPTLLLLIASFMGRFQSQKSELV
jgi:hypothetical protein